MAVSFQFTAGEFAAVERLLSPERFATYLAHAGGNRDKAFRLYTHNWRLSSGLFETIGGFEVALRNSVHLTLSGAFQSDAWYDHVPFSWWKHEALAVQRAKDQIVSRKKHLVPGRVIAELNFGFWCGITGKPYVPTLWIPHLHKAFPHKRLAHRDAHRRLNEIRELRNRIAHHECILHIKLDDEYSRILEALGWICPITRSWIESQSSFPSTWQSPPV
jgi:hypothetical protein